MRYLDFSWHHKHLEEPVRLVSEIDGEGFEVRKLEYFRDGSVGFAKVGASSRGTELGSERIPSAAEIEAEGEFSVSEISSEKFELLWRTVGG